LFFFFLQWLAWFSKTREGKEEGKEKLIAGVPLRAVGEHLPHHLDEGGEAHQKQYWKAIFSAVWALHMPPKRHGNVRNTRQPLLNFNLYIKISNYP
jgi:hypothetical protein